MKLAIKKEEFIKGLQRIQGVVDKKNTMPILANMLLSADSEGVEIIATDLEIALRGRYKAEVHEQGAVTVSAKKVYEIVRELPEEDVLVQVEEDDRVKISSGHAEFRLVGLSKDEYPSIPDLADVDMVTLDSAVLKDMIKKTLFAVGDNDTRYVLNGLYVLMTQAKGGGLNIRMVGTDGHRLSMIDRVIDVKHKDENVIVPKKTMMELRRLLDEEPTLSTPVSLGFTKNHALFNRDGLVMVSKLIDGNYPNYLQVVPPSNEKKVSVRRDAFSHAVKRVSILAKEKTNAVKLQLDKNGLVLSTNNPELGEAREELQVEYSGEELTIGFNSRYILDALSAMDKEGVRLEFNDSLSPCLIVEEGNEGYKCVVMPMRV